MRNSIKRDDDLYLDKLERAAFNYFLENVKPLNGLIADTNRTGSPCSIAVTGFGLTAYTVGVERGWLQRADAVRLTLAALKFFWNATSGEGLSDTGYRGFFYHFLDKLTGQRVWDCELSMVDTALLMAGVLSAHTYYSGRDVEETQIRDLAEKLYRRVDWNWARSAKGTIAQGWRPEVGFYHYGWEGYDEGTILYVLSLAAPDFPLKNDSYENWSVTYQWENIYGYDFLYAGPLFIHQFSHMWIDFRGIRDDFMREKKIDYFENSRRAVYVQREYARINPLQFDGYSEDCWGLSAGDGPSGRSLRTMDRDRWCLGYAARGVPFGPDDGTLSPPAIAGSVPFAPDVAISALRHVEKTYPTVVQEGRLPTGFNPTAKNEDGTPWVSEGYFGLDQGVIVMMLENYRSGFVWKLMRACPFIREGLKRAGFTQGWLK